MEAMDFLLGTEYNYTYIAIGLGMVISLFLTETLGIMAGGIIVPGYFALHLQDYFSVFITFFIGFLTFLLIKILSNYIMIFGRRRVIF